MATALGNHDGVRNNWEPYDLTASDGIKVEVKSAAYIQTWQQKQYSNISFSIRQTMAWDSETNEFDETAQRQADVYVFAVLTHKDQATIDPLNFDQWVFYIIATAQLDEHLQNQKTVTLGRLLELGVEEVGFEAIGQTIKAQSAAPANG